MTKLTKSQLIKLINSRVGFLHQFNSEMCFVGDLLEGDEESVMLHGPQESYEVLLEGAVLNDKNEIVFRDVRFIDEVNHIHKFVLYRSVDIDFIKSVISS